MNIHHFVSGHQASEVLEVLFGILLASLLGSTGDRVVDVQIATYFGGLADLLTDNLPLICLVFFDRVAELYRLCGVSARLGMTQ